MLIHANTKPFCSFCGNDKKEDLIESTISPGKCICNTCVKNFKQFLANLNDNNGNTPA